MIKQVYVTAILIALVFEIGFGQASRPFPQNADYSFGFKPGTITYKAAQNSYNKWKNLLLVECNDDYRVTCEGRDETRVEAIGFGMILTAYFGDKEKFDGLYHFYKSKRTQNANNMMAWNVSCDGINDPGSATDGDIDVAFVLTVAYNQWGSNYLKEAENVIQVIKNSVVITCDTLFALAPGYSKESETGPVWGGCDLTDIQYYTPAFFRIFAEVSGDKDWNKLADDTYTILNAAAHPKTGLVPDWQSVSGIPGGKSDRTPYFRYDACRVPWRIALDYLWNGNPHAKEWCTKVSGWANTIGPANIKDGYNLDGTENSQGYHNSAFVGGFAVAAMCNSQAAADTFGTEMGRLDDTHWFSLSTRSLYLLSITGNFWQPTVLTK
jgi:endo-1,4-beta-D-glucanase Y